MLLGLQGFLFFVIWHVSDTHGTQTDTQTHTPRGKDTSAVFILYTVENPWCLKSSGSKHEVNESADLPLRRRMSYREH